MLNSRIHREFAARILILCFLFNGNNTLTAQAQNEISKQDVYKKDLANRLKILREYDGTGNKKNSSLQRNSLSYSKKVTDEINSNSILSEKKYNFLIQQTRLAYLDIIKRKVTVPPSRLYIEVINPWQDFKTDLVDIKPGVKQNNIEIKNIITGVQYAAFLICNLDQTTQQFSLRLANQRITSQFNFYDAKFILSRGYKKVPDALVPITHTTMITPGEIKIIFMIISGRESGIERNKIQVRTRTGMNEISLQVQTYPIGLKPQEIKLNAVNWAYYFYPFLKAKEKDVTMNLKDHFINTIVIPTGYLPSFQNPARTKEIDEYFRRCIDFENIILGLDLRRQSKTKEYLSPQWKAKFTQWYAFTLNQLKKAGVHTANKKVYLYVIDEPTSKEIPFVLEFIKWVKIAIPSAQLYATINNKESTDALLRILDVAQLYNRSLLNLNIQSDNMKKIWIYDTKSKALAPYQSFRLMAWEAFFRDYGGIGFWNYADLAKGSNSGESAWDDFDGKYADYNVVYDLNSKIINSRRWEAFRLGIEDYYILQLYAKKYGMGPTKQFCLNVLKSSGNISLADSIRNLLLQRLNAE